jgi:hypothetical protein
MIVLISFENAKNLLERNKAKAQANLPSPNTQRVLELLVRCFLCPNSLDIESEKLCLRLLEENYGSGFVYSHLATMVTEEIKYSIQLAFPNQCLYSRSIGLEWGKVKFNNTHTAHIQMNYERFKELR